jgi:tRNA-dihydrouridine synthase B
MFIGSLKLSSPLILAPLAGISDLPFRLLNRAFGCELAFTEMISARGLAHRDKKTLAYLASCDDDTPRGIQLLGSNADLLCRALEVLETHQHEVIDFNAACPVPKVIKKGEGASLLKDPKKLRDLLKRSVQNTTKPVTVKIRSGWDHHSINAVEVVCCAQDAGIHAIFVHGRTMAQGYHGTVDYDIIRQVKQAVCIPVIGSGDVLSPLQAKKMFSETGCDGVVIARGALGNPWIFRHTMEFLAQGTLPPRPAAQEIMHTMIRHLTACCDFYGDRHGAVIFRKFFVWYTKGFDHIRSLRTRAFQAKSREEMLEIIQNILKCNTEH